MTPQAHHVTNAKDIPFKTPMLGKYPVTLEGAQKIADDLGRDVYWLEGDRTAYYEAVSNGEK